MSIRGFITTWDAGNPSTEERQEAREVDEVDDPKGMATAIIQEVDGEVDSRTALRGPAMS